MKRKNPGTSLLKSPVVALLTDFGLEDHYVGSLKAVILSVNPKASVVDISHHVMPQQIQQAGYLLWSAFRFFPKGTIFVVVVDPGVGTDRRIIVIRTPFHTFLAPDNSVLDFVVNEVKVVEAVEIDFKKAKKFLPENISSTFHGRDVFAPLAAHVSKGRRLTEIGQEIELRNVPFPFVRQKSDVLKPRILHIDHFGNIVTNVFGGSNSSHEIQMMTLRTSFVSRWVMNYEEAPDRTPCLIVDSSGLVEIVLKKDSAAKLLNVSVHTPLSVRWF